MKDLLTEMENEDIQNKMIKMIRKIIELHKPEQVEELVVNIDEAIPNIENFYYIQLQYISPILKPLFNTLADKEHVENVLGDITYKWDSSIKNAIESFLNTDVVINSEIKYKKD